MMEVRRPAIDFSNTPAQWAAIPEFAQNMNSASLWIPHLERFLNRVLARAITELGDKPEYAQLRRDVKLFIRQEANHYSLHADFNRILPRSGYETAAFDALFEAEFEKLFQTRSLKFLCAYCEGFETFGPPSAMVWHDHIDDLLAGADPDVVRLWKWHLLEEYEHRSVCHDVFHAVKGGYFLRLYGFFFQLRQLTGFSKMVNRHLMERDRADMTPDQRRASVRRQKRVERRIAWLTLSRLLGALSPFYDPRRCREPAGLKAYAAELKIASA